MHLVIVPLAVVLSSIRPSVNALTVDVVVDEVTSICRAVSPEELTVAVLLPVFILTFVACIVWPNLLTLTVLFVFKPPALVASTISVVVNSIAMCLIILPISVVNIAISVN